MEEDPVQWFAGSARPFLSVSISLHCNKTNSLAGGFLTAFLIALSGTNARLTEVQFQHSNQQQQQKTHGRSSNPTHCIEFLHNRSLCCAIKWAVKCVHTKLSAGNSTRTQKKAITHLKQQQKKNPLPGSSLHGDRIKNLIKNAAAKPPLASALALDR